MSKAYPEPVYEWRRNEKLFVKGNLLQINQNVTRSDNGASFECVATNKYGSHVATTTLNVMCKF